MKWRIKKDFEQGILWGGKPCLGYALEDKRFIVIPDEARSYNRFINYTLLDMVPIQSAKSLMNEVSFRRIQQNGIDQAS